jgi:deoxyribodipyrimidine photo-lyase
MTLATKSIKQKAISIFWFRRDLRLHDNHGFYEALKQSEAVLPIFIFDKNILEGIKSKADKRVAFIHSTLMNMQDHVKTAGSSLLILHDSPQNAFEKLLSQFDIKAVFTNQDYEPYAIQRDKEVAALLSKHNIPFHAFKDQVIFEKEEITKSDGKPYTIYTPYSKVWKEKYHADKKVRYPSEKHLDKLWPTKPYPVPTLTPLGFNEIQFETPSIKPDKEVIQHYAETRNLPAVNGTSRMSIHLRFGTVSIRELVAVASKWNETWLNELIWREFFMMILFHFPQVVTQSFKSKYDRVPWRNNEKEFNLWRKGETGYPLVDAGMRELNETGFMHNRVRMVVASFLTKHLLIDWRWGEAYFAEKLIDYELSSNNGNWQWCAGCGCDAAPYFRIFNPTEQQKKFDPDFVYIKKWINPFKPGYLDPMVDHDFARKRVLQVFKQALNE